ncbi:ATPase [Candidatus Woesearchaeota archaeon]|nr:MAG: ATPase [Candidatus Woesearchaeota archaeon]
MKYEKIVPDSSIIIEGKLSELIESKEIQVKEILIHDALISALEHFAYDERSIGYLGLDEIKKLRDLTKDNLKIKGKKPSFLELKNLSLSYIDSLVRQMAYDEDATLITSEKVQATSASSMGINVHFIELPQKGKLLLEKFFDKETMSVHLKENVIPYGKKGFPGNWRFLPLRKTKMQQEEIKELSRDIIESTRSRKDAFIEVERPGSTIVQAGKFRIVITRPPFSDGWEITAVRPVKKLKLEDYNLSPKLMERISKHAEGILISGSPGEGKTTIASAIAEYYSRQDKIVKTIEAPRDLVLPDSVTQYAISHGDAQEIHDILLLSRPDYTVFDEMRNTDDFKLFTDLRLSGIGLLGVVHATNPIDAVQRFVGRIELGVIPQVIDTVLFIKGGTINKVLSLQMTVKVPYGMVEADLARPVTEVKDFETGQVEYEIYTYGEETVVVPVKGTTSSTPTMSLAKRAIERELSRYSPSVEANVVSEHKAIVYVPEKYIAKIIGAKGKNIDKIEKDLGISIDIEPIQSKRKEGKLLKYDIKERGNNIYFITKRPSTAVDTFIDGNYLFTSTTSKKGEIKLNKKSKLGLELIKALDLNKNIEIRESYV